MSESSFLPIQPLLLTGQCTNIAQQDHNYVADPLEIVVRQNCIENDNDTENKGGLDHNYTITDSPKTLKRKMRGLEHELCVARKKLKLKQQHTRKLKKK